MSYLMRRLTQTRLPRALLPSTPLAISSFHTSTVRQALSESDHDAVDRKEKIEHHKQDTITKAKDGKGEWKSELASNSEQAVKADNYNMSMEEMQKHSVKKAEDDK